MVWACYYVWVGPRGERVGLPFEFWAGLAGLGAGLVWGKEVGAGLGCWAARKEGWAGFGF